MPATAAATPASDIEARFAPVTRVETVAWARPRRSGGTEVWRIVVTDAWTGVTNQPAAKRRSIRCHASWHAAIAATVAPLLAENRDALDSGALHLLAKRGDVRGVRWLLDHGADPNAGWSHWGAEVTPLHLAAAQGHAEVVRVLLAAGADPSIRDSKHDGDAMGWAEYGRVPPAPNRREIVDILEQSSS
jgi:Ankyrin repeats (3 copies)